MLDPIKRWLGILVARYHFRAVRDPILSFRGAFVSARSALLVLPFDRNETPRFQELTEALKARFAQENITVIAAEHHYDIGRMLPRSTVVRVPQRELTPLFLPGKELIASIASRTAVPSSVHSRTVRRP